MFCLRVSWMVFIIHKQYTYKHTIHFGYIKQQQQNEQTNTPPQKWSFTGNSESVRERNCMVFRSLYRSRTSANSERISKQKHGSGQPYVNRKGKQYANKK
eukprot:m.22824 g.22824  ORF g.22824 m.22824 type:complete len:100 (+) comp5482_c0_seq3:259-558(+)